MLKDGEWVETLNARKYSAQDAKKTRLHVRDRLIAAGVGTRLDMCFARWDEGEDKEIIHIYFKNRHKLFCTRKWFDEQPDGAFMMISGMDRAE